MEEAPRRTLSASTPRHPPLVRTSPPRRAKRRGGSGDMLGRRERPPGRQRPGAERGVHGKNPSRPSNRPSPTDAPRMGIPPCVTAPRSPPPPPIPLLRPPAWPRPEGKGLRRQATAGRGRDGTRLPHPRRATEGERETNRPRETEEKTIPPQPPHGRSGDRAGAEATAPVTPGRATRSRASGRATGKPAETNPCVEG